MSSSVRLIAAADEANGIGLMGALPWPRIPEDMEQFRWATIYSCVVMGRRTWESLGRALDRRHNMVLSRTVPFACGPGLTVVRTPEEAMIMAGDGPLWVIGGAETYRAFLPWATELWLTRVRGVYPADTRLGQDIVDKFPVLDVYAGGFADGDVVSYQRNRRAA